MRILLTTFGSFGDIHPYLAIALELQRRGHQPTIATSEMYRAKINGAGVEFFPVRPDLPPLDEAAALIEKVMAGPTGSKFLFKELLMPGLRGAYEDLTIAVQNTDVFVSHVATLAAPIVAEKTGVPWISTVLAPISFFSVFDPSVPPVAERLYVLRHLGPKFWALFRNLALRELDNWVKPYYELRREVGLPRGKNPALDGQHSPQRVLAMFSPLLGAPQPDWLLQTVQTGFCFYDKRGAIYNNTQGDEIDSKLEAFLQSGDAPIIFTLGSSAVFDAGKFYEESARAAQILNRRAILLIGDARNRPQHLPEGVAAFDYAPYSDIFPRAAAIVHQGGVGTTAQAMRAGKPMLIMPFSHDQPDHAHRMQRLGIGRRLNRNKFNAERAARELKILLDEANGFTSRAAQVGEKVRAENGVSRTCDEIETFV